MSNNPFRRNLRLFASTGVLACAMIGTPVSVRVQSDGPIWHFEAPLRDSGTKLARPGELFEFGTANIGTERHADAERRDALARLGLADDTAYASPVLITLSRAQAASGSGDGGASGGDGGDSSGSGSDGGGGDSSGSGSDGGGGDSSGSGSDGGGDSIGPSHGDDSSGNSGPGGASGPSSSPTGPSGASGSVGASGGSFGDVEQVGPSLSENEEAEAIIRGWQ
jgi:hypothetical protein